MKNACHIILVGDEKFVKFSAVTMYSIVKHTDHSKTMMDYQLINNTIYGEEFRLNDISIEEIDGYVFHYLTNGISAQKQEKIDKFVVELNKFFPTEVIVHSFPEDEFLDLPTWRKSFLVYYRLKISQFIPEGTEKVLYLDSDIIVNCDIRELFALDMKHSVLAVGPQGYLERSFSPLKGGSPIVFKGNYFNAGILMINFSEWKKQNIEAKTLEFLKNYHVVALDQDALNVIVEKPIYLSPTWNFGTYPSIDYIKTKYDTSLSFTDFEWINRLEDDKDIKIIHYCDDKPWKSSCSTMIGDILCFEYQPFAVYWWYMAENTPVFYDELLEIRESEEYKMALTKEAKKIKMLQGNSLFSKIYLIIKRYNSRLRPYIKKLEVPIKRKRNQIKAYFKSKK